MTIPKTTAHASVAEATSSQKDPRRGGKLQSWDGTHLFSPSTPFGFGRLTALAFRLQSFQKSLNRSGASAVYLTVEAIDLWPR